MILLREKQISIDKYKRELETKQEKIALNEERMCDELLFQTKIIQILSLILRTRGNTFEVEHTNKKGKNDAKQSNLIISVF